MIELININYKYEGAKTYSLKNINLKIKRGECILLTGPSGSGKSTFTRIINGLIPNEYNGEYSGDISIENFDISSAKMWEISNKVGSVFQNPRNQFFSLDTTGEIVFGMENLSFPADKMKKQFKETVRALRIEELLDRNIFELSGGEKQLIAIASIYALNPEIYIMDEPSANLDRTNILKLRNIIKKLKSQGKTIIIAEHRIYYLTDIMDKMLYMKNGEIIEEFDDKRLKEMNEDEFRELGIRSFNQPEIEIPNFDIYSKNRSVLEIKNLILPYGERRKAINLSIKENEIIGIAGKVGCGKTTLARIITGLLKEESGQIYFEGEILSLKNRSKNTYMVMQDANYQLFMDSVEEELKFSNIYGYKKNTIKEIYNILDTLDLFDYREEHPMRLSGGQKQRVSVGISLMMKSKIIIFDEPTSGLDYQNMLRVSGLIKGLSQKSKAIIVISHDYEFINNTCKRIYKI